MNRLNWLLIVLIVSLSGLLYLKYSEPPKNDVDHYLIAADTLFTTVFVTTTDNELGVYLALYVFSSSYEYVIITVDGQTIVFPSHLVKTLNVIPRVGDVKPRKKNKIHA